MKALMDIVERVACGTATVLITGETGTGKELIARAIHARSHRAEKPWVDVNCAALPEHLVESELFGYEKGAFSGADSAKPGLFELADKGTLFLDEIGELEPKIQVKLLRVLDGLPYFRLGGSRKVSVDVRIVAATNQILEDSAKASKFRSDLFHRLSQLQIYVPPLRDRHEDIAALAAYFLEQSHPGMRLSFGALEALQGYSWPGNVRELRNAIVQSSSIARGKEIVAVDLPSSIVAARASMFETQPLEPVQDAHSQLEDIEKQAIIRALARTGGHQSIAAEQLGISRRTLSRKLKQYRIETNAAATLGARDEQLYRAVIVVPVSIVSRHGEQAATSINLSMGGISIDGIQNPFQLSGGLKIGFTLPGDIDPISARAQIVWADAHGRVGLRFIGTNEAHAARIKKWVLEQQNKG